MAHSHELQDGTRTGPDIIEPDNVLLHFHMVEGEKTSSENMGEEHTHTFNGEITSGPIEMSKKLVSKQINGVITETKQTERAGVTIGVVEGYIATWDIDRGQFGTKDQFVKGAFLASIADHLTRGRQIRLKDHHGRTIGGFPIENVREDDRGLFGVGEINIDMQQGRDAYSLAVQGVLTDFSIGFSVDEFTEESGLRTITKATIWEGSIVDEPMNPKANIINVKTAVPFQDLPLAEKSTAFDLESALARVKDFTDSEDGPSVEYKNAFLRYEKEDEGDFGAYRLPIADIINGKLVAVPEAIFKAAEDINSVPPTDKGAVIKHLERYYAKMGMNSPFEENEKQYFVVDDVKSMDVRSLEKAFKASGAFSKNASKYLAGLLKVDKPEENKDTKSLLEILTDFEL